MVTVLCNCNLKMIRRQKMKILRREMMIGLIRDLVRFPAQISIRTLPGVAPDGDDSRRGKEFLFLRHKVLLCRRDTAYRLIL